MAARTRGYGITKADMEANRLVFVYLRDSKPRRKVAVPVPDNYTWDLFINQVGGSTRNNGLIDDTIELCCLTQLSSPSTANVQVKLKLKLTGVGDIFLASVRLASTWQDIQSYLQALSHCNMSYADWPEDQGSG